MVHKICVVGAGIIGMSTAVAIQENIPEAKVVIIAADFSPNLVSDVAAGLIEPYLSGKDEQSVNRWCRETMKRIRQYMKEVPNGGAQEMSGYRFSKDPNIPSWISLMDNVHILSPEEIKQKHPYPQRSGIFYTTLYLEPTKFLHYLTDKFLHNGGTTVKQKVESLGSIATEYDCVVNCTGLGASELVTDPLLHPIRGQIIRVRCPAVKHFFIDDSSYVLLNDDCLILGGTADRNCWSRAVSPETAQRIMNANQENLPALKSCEVISHHVGLRPGRCDVRLELEKRTVRGKKVSIVHNYGHGGSGVTLFWGCALDTVALVRKALQEEHRAKL